jgi:hypothetical protein
MVHMKRCVCWYQNEHSGRGDSSRLTSTLTHLLGWGVPPMVLSTSNPNCPFLARSSCGSSSRGSIRKHFQGKHNHRASRHTGSDN